MGLKSSFVLKFLLIIAFKIRGTFVGVLASRFQNGNWILISLRTKPILLIKLNYSQTLSRFLWIWQVSFRNEVIFIFNTRTMFLDHWIWFSLRNKWSKICYEFEIKFSFLNK